MEADVLEVAGGEPARRVGTGGVERDVAEVEEPGVADDDVEADRHHRDTIITTMESVLGMKSPISGRSWRLSSMLG